MFSRFMRGACPVVAGLCLMLHATPSLATGPTVDTKGEFSFYVDDTDVTVITPGIDVSVVHPLDGWSVSGGYMLDVVSAASVDIITTASPAWLENRHVGVISGSYKPNEWQGSLFASVSREPDYLSTTGGASLNVELDDKHITPLIGYNFSHDIGGRSGTSYDVYSLILQRHSLQLSVAFVLNKSTLLTLTTDGMFEFGSQEKPYRMVPLFTPAAAQEVKPGASVEFVNQARLMGAETEESTPKTRQRYALSGRLAWRGDDTTWILKERLYTESWGLIASTTELNNIYDLGHDLYAGLHGRFHVQSGVDFYKLAYVGTTISGRSDVPRYRTGDRELSPLYTATGGVGLSWEFAETWSSYLQVDGGYTKYTDALFIKQRLSFLAALLLGKEF